jgi:alkylated DNA repair protein (DNA oxidative demethylase)
MDLFSGLTDESTHLQLGTASWLLRGFALRKETAILQALEAICAAAPPRAMQTPGGQRMSVRTTSCGVLGWVSDTSGYRYETIDPLSGAPWPAMPAVFSALAAAAAAEAGFPDFQPDACLINCYEAGAKMGLHQDKDERDFTQPIVSVSLGIGAVFLFGGLKRSDRAFCIALNHGDVVVWGGEDRLRFHGVQPVKPAVHRRLGGRRINLTFRKAA